MIKKFYLWITGRTYKPDFHDFITQGTDPVATPLLSSVEHDKARQVYTEWLVDAFAEPTVVVKELGDTEFKAAHRRGNYLQISYHMAEASNCELATTTADGTSVLASRCDMASKMLKRDIECSLLSDNVASPGGEDKPTVAAGLGSVIKTNVIDCTGGTPPAYSFVESGYPQVAAVAGPNPPQQLTQKMVNDLAEMVWKCGGSIGGSALMMHPSIKKQFDTFASTTTTTCYQKLPPRVSIWRRFLNWVWPPEPPFKWVGAADLYVSDFGTLNIIPNRFMPPDRVYLLDAAMIRVSFLRRFRTVPVPSTSDSKKQVILCEWTLKVLNEAGCGQIRGLTC